MVPTHRISRERITARLAPDALAAARALSAVVTECAPVSGDATLFSAVRRNRAPGIALTWMRTPFGSPLHWSLACAPEPRCPACGSRHEATEDRFGYVTCDACYGTGNEAHVSTLVLPAQAAFALCGGPAKPAKAPRLSAAQRAKVRSLMEDEGWSRAEAVAWVTTFRGEVPS